MCGIVGYVGKRDATPVLIEGLHRLEYRGYDSAGLAVMHRGRLQVTKTAGRVQDLRDKLSGQTAKSTIGIGHTRWATHGEPNETNAHPHTDTAARVAIVHNGIIENAEQLRDQLQASGVRLVTDTDTEALAHMIAAELAEREDVTLEDAVIRTLHRVEGAYGLVVLDIKNPDQLVVARNGSPDRARPRRERDVRRLRRGRPGPLHPPGHLPGGRRGRDDNGERLPHQDADRHATTATTRRRPPWTPTPTTTSSASTATTCARRSTSSRTRIRRALQGRLDDRFATARLGGINLDARELRNIKQRQVPRLRLRLLRRPDGRGAGRGAGPHPRRRRACQRVPLPEPRRGPGHAVRRGLASPARRATR